MDEEDAWRAISAAEEELRSEEAWEDYQPGDGIPEVFITRLMEREMLTREDAGATAQQYLSHPAVIDYMIHIIAKQTGRQPKPHDPCFHPDGS